MWNPGPTNIPKTKHWYSIEPDPTKLPVPVWHGNLLRGDSQRFTPLRVAGRSGSGPIIQPNFDSTSFSFPLTGFLSCLSLVPNIDGKPILKILHGPVGYASEEIELVGDIYENTPFDLVVTLSNP